ncbi:Uncharacterized protein SCF082_LOCUS42182 [Durusdinium trenchii]|uniref:Uncharacterized protein n=1 Tax=Durusdinium trenchii TaxID=1381693 RepID=A0ABP0QMA0_9DINO
MQPSSVPRLVGQPLSADEYLLSAMALRQDAQSHADADNYLTFGEEAGWDADDMLASNLAGQRPGLGECLVGTCGFMGTGAAKYAQRLRAVELNCTFHDQGNGCYEKQAASYAKLGLRVVVKVSGYATHSVALGDPTQWWPWLHAKYAPFVTELVNEGILVGLLWQLPPSFNCTEEHLRRLEILGQLLRSRSQRTAWLELRHVFEFRHSSWFKSSALREIMRRHSLSLVSLHVMNDTGWAGDLNSGWHALPDETDEGDFVYLRCFGARSRSIGLYDMSFLKEAMAVAKRATSAVIMFGQGDAPQQALSNAWELQDLCCLSQGSLSSLPLRSGGSEVGKRVRGVVLRRGRDGLILVDVEGGPQGCRTGYLGSRHSRRRGLGLRAGTVLTNLQVESEEKGHLVLSVCEADTAVS